MATHDYVIANGTGAAVRSDLNNALAAIVSNNSSSSEPATKYAYQWWADTTTGQLKLRNSANNGWVTIFELDGTMLMEDGTVSAPGLAFASDLNTGFFKSAADKINFATGGVERLEIGSSEVVFNDGSNDVDFRVESNGQTHMLFVDGGNDAVGIGTGTVDSAAKAAISNGGAEGIEFRAGNSSGVCEFLTYNRSGNAYTDLKYDAATHQFKISGQEKARLDSSGRLGIGTSSPSSKLHVSNTSGESEIRITANSSNQGILRFGNQVDPTLASIRFNSPDDSLQFYGNNDTERMRISSGGSLFVGCTAAAYNEKLSVENASNTAFFNCTVNSNVSNVIFKHAYAQGSQNSTMLEFYNNANSVVGSIKCTGSATSYNTSSDYRLKENVVVLDGAITRVKQLLPKRFNFIVDADTTVDGFLAHEAQTVVPEAVTGEKDGEEMQGIDQSKLVPLLTAALQEAITKIETLETKVAALEAG